MMYSQGRKQRGVGMVGLIFILAIIGFIAWISMKLIPMVIESSKIANSMENLKAQPEVSKKSSADVEQLLFNRLGVDGINRFNHENFYKNADGKEGHAKYERDPTGTGFKLTIKYDQSELLFSNIYLTVKFDKTIEAK